MRLSLSDPTPEGPRLGLESISHIAVVLAEEGVGERAEDSARAGVGSSLSLLVFLCACITHETLVRFAG